jgi:hypothetical protein
VERNGACRRLILDGLAEVGPNELFAPEAAAAGRERDQDMRVGGGHLEQAKRTPSTEARPPALLLSTAAASLSMSFVHWQQRSIASLHLAPHDLHSADALGRVKCYRYEAERSR